MPIKTYHVSIALEALLNAIDYSFTYEQEKIEQDPYSAIETALLHYTLENPHIKNKTMNLLLEIKSLSRKNIFKILENEDDKRLILKSIKELKSYIN